MHTKAYFFGEGEIGMGRKIKPLLPGQVYCSPRQAAFLLGVGESAIYKLYHSGCIPGARRLGGAGDGDWQHERILIPVAWVMPENANPNPNQ